MFAFDSTFFAPKCIKVTTNQAVTFSGVSGFHPIAPQACGPVNVFPTQESSSIPPVVRTFATVGNYGIYCPNHDSGAGTSMALQIQVVP
jgi:hypothetical protein